MVPPNTHTGQRKLGLSHPEIPQENTGGAPRAGREPSTMGGRSKEKFGFYFIHVSVVYAFPKMRKYIFSLPEKPIYFQKPLRALLRCSG